MISCGKMLPLFFFHFYVQLKQLEYLKCVSVFVFLRVRVCICVFMHIRSVKHCDSVMRNDTPGEKAPCVSSLLLLLHYIYL